MFLIIHSVHLHTVQKVVLLVALQLSEVLLDAKSWKYRVVFQPVFILDDVRCFVMQL